MHSTSFLFNRKSNRSPAVIAHRGGVVGPGIPENSAAAIRRAAQNAYDMVELDVRETADHVPVILHGWGPSGNLRIDFGDPRNIGELYWDEAVTLRYVASTEPLLSLTRALELCTQFDLAVMLDFKIRQPSTQFLQAVKHTLDTIALPEPTLTLSHLPEIRAHLRDRIHYPLSLTRVEEQQQEISPHIAVPEQASFHFDWGSRINPELIRRLHANGLAVIAAINSFHYPAHARLELARADIQRLLTAGVDAFQIDSIFESLLHSSI